MKLCFFRLTEKRKKFLLLVSLNELPENQSIENLMSSLSFGWDQISKVTNLIINRKQNNLSSKKMIAFQCFSVKKKLRKKTFQRENFFRWRRSNGLLKFVTTCAISDGFLTFSYDVSTNHCRISLLASMFKYTGYHWTNYPTEAKIQF